MNLREKVALKRDVDFQPALEKFMAEPKAGDTTSEMHGFCSGWIARRALVAQEHRELVDALDAAKTVLSDIYKREGKSFHGSRVKADIGSIMPMVNAALAKEGA